MDMSFNRKTDITSRAMLVAFSVSQWTAHKRDKAVSAEVAANKGAKREAGNYNKVLIGKGAPVPATTRPKTWYWLQFDRLNDNAGVVVGVATPVVNNGDKLPAEKLVTVPSPPTHPQQSTSKSSSSVLVLLLSA